MKNSCNSLSFTFHLRIFCFESWYWFPFRSLQFCLWSLQNTPLSPMIILFCQPHRWDHLAGSYMFPFLLTWAFELPNVDKHVFKSLWWILWQPYAKIPTSQQIYSTVFLLLLVTILCITQLLLWFVGVHGQPLLCRSPHSAITKIILQHN